MEEEQVQERQAVTYYKFEYWLTDGDFAHKNTFRCGALNQLDALNCLFAELLDCDPDVKLWKIDSITTVLKGDNEGA